MGCCPSKPEEEAKITEEQREALETALKDREKVLIALERLNIEQKSLPRELRGGQR